MVELEQLVGRKVIGHLVNKPKDSGGWSDTFILFDNGLVLRLSEDFLSDSFEVMTLKKIRREYKVLLNSHGVKWASGYKTALELYNKLTRFCPSDYWS